MSDSGPREETAGGVLQPPVTLEPRKPPRRVAALTVIPDDWKPRRGVPASRAACRDGPRPCPYVRCEWHLWLTEGRDRQGRPRRDGRPQKSVLRPHSNQSCGADIADAVERGVNFPIEKIGEALGITARAVRLIVVRATRKLAADPDARELLTLMANRQ